MENELEKAEFVAIVKEYDENFKESYINCLNSLKKLQKSSIGYPESQRAFALTKTKLEESELWLNKGICLLNLKIGVK